MKDYRLQEGFHMSPKNFIIEFNLSEHTAREVTLSDVKIDANGNMVYWCHCDLNNAESKNMIQLFQLPEAIVKLFNVENTLPIFVDEDDALTIQVESPLSVDPLSSFFALSNLFIYLRKQFCFTASFAEQPAVKDFISHSQIAIRYAKTSCFILFLLLDSIISDYAKLIFNYELLTDELDSKVQLFEEDIYQKVMHNKQQLMKVKHSIVSIQEILMRISGRKISVISEQCKQSLSNLCNHTHLIINEADSIREILNGFLSQIDNILMQKMNKTMKLLTAFAAIFLPLSLITGIYGMNFHDIPELSWKYGYLYVLALIIGTGVGLFCFFKKKGWF